MTATVCLICGRPRIVPTHSRGDTDCRCRVSSLRDNGLVFVPGLVFSNERTGRQTITAPCGRRVPYQNNRN